MVSCMAKAEGVVASMTATIACASKPMSCNSQKMLQHGWHRSLAFGTLTQLRCACSAKACIVANLLGCRGITRRRRCQNGSAQGGSLHAMLCLGKHEDVMFVLVCVHAGPHALVQTDASHIETIKRAAYLARR